MTPYLDTFYAVLEVTRDSLLTFSEAKDTKTVSALLGFLLSVLLDPIELFLIPDPSDKMGERQISFYWSRKFRKHLSLSLGFKGPVSMK